MAAGEGGGPWRVRVDGEPEVEEYSVADIAGPADFAAAFATVGIVTGISISVNFIQFEDPEAE
jgi:hypothetical protein